MTKWKITKAIHPKPGQIIWAFDLFYNSVHLAEWDGENLCDDGTPFVESLTENGDD